MKSRLVIASLLLVVSLAAPPSRADPGADSVNSTSGFSPEINQWADSVGEEFLAHSRALGEFNRWINSRSEARDRGYIVSVNDPASGSTKILWNGTDLEEQQAFEKRAAELGIEAHFAAFPYAFGQVQDSLAGIRSARPDFERLSFSVDMVAALSVEEMESVVIKGHFSDENMPAGMQESSRQLVQDVAQSASLIVPVKVEVASQGAETYARRVADTSPFWGGGLAKSSSYCSTGFVVSVDGKTRSTTARHCTGHFTAVEGSGDYGDSYSPTFNGGRLLDSSGSGRVFDGAPSESHNPGVPVKGFQDLNPGDFVYTQGGNFGPRCDIRVQSVNIEFDDTQGVFGAIWGIQVNGRIAAGAGDSGGPVITLDGDGFRAAGLIQGTAGNRSLSAEACRDASYTQSDRCSYDVVFSSMRTLADQWGASLVTSG
ncbi:hypothetical protein SAMN06295924_10568 [Rathayibacter rathayi NCPPB 2980 = VKM Ac-1601]|uniref:hypothetical protein n=1 Tax=Rathayibacter rathayi TaxID=33887 RepID=UPI000BCDF3F3|nr:hypothetical protein [Rathayibacter rathayi]TWD68576.1 hypothetical protein FB469_0262 [Rathayibacter rathayi]SOE04711.1 hypothetical protein SAMN06295924_10568 [Rathayibacter rathayi NCPPB 2980 = VKM Ac-1601]